MVAGRYSRVQSFGLCRRSGTSGLISGGDSTLQPTHQHRAVDDLAARGGIPLPGLAELCADLRCTVIGVNDVPVAGSRPASSAIP